MFACSSLFVIFLNFLLTNVECSGIYYQMENGRRNQKRNNGQIDNSPNWMKAISKIKEELLNIQAIIAKDEELQHNCMTGSQKSEKRHLMCAGSILTDRHVLTSATCIHEATHIRHNIKAPLVVVIAPLKANPQVIRVDSYRVHPEHSVFPYNQQHTKYNVAVIRLACSIAIEHLTKIVLPKAPYTEICSSDNCMVAILRRVGKTSIVIYDTRAKHIPLTLRKRRSTEMVKELGNGTTTVILRNIREKLKEKSKIVEPLLLVHKKQVQKILPQKHRKEINFSETAKNGDLEFQNRSDFLELGSNSKDEPFEKLGMLFSEKIMNSSFRLNKISEQQKVLSTLEEITTSNIADQYVFQEDSDQNYRVRLFSVRASSGFQGCPQSGSPVMFEKTQAAIVSISCDDRQSGVSWKYTDVFLNSDWITGITANWDLENPISDSAKRTKSNKTASISGCNTCIYNFFIDLTGSKDKTNCRDLNKDSDEFKMCASHNGQRMTNKQISFPNKQTSIPESDKISSSKVSLQKPNQQKESRQFATSQKIKNKVSNLGNEENQNLKSSKILKIDPSIKLDNIKGLKSNIITEKKDIDKHAHKNIGKNLAKDSAKVFPYLTKNTATDAANDYDKDFGGVLKMDFEQDFDKDFEKKLQQEFQQDFKKDYYLRNMEVSNQNRLRKQIAGNQGHESLKLNEYKNLNFSKVVQPANLQQSVNYNPLSKKFHNLQMMLARIQKSIPEKNIEKVVFRGQRKIFPQMEISNSGQGIKYLREEKTKPVVDRQFAVFFRDRERGANNHHNAYPGFNGYFL